MKPLVAITGGLGDIGRAIGKAFAAKGDQVAVCDLAERAPDGFPWHYFPADVQSEESVRAWFDAMEKEFGRPPTLVVVNAGVHCTNGHGGCLETGFAEWTRTIGVNLTGAWLTAREGALRLLAAGETGDAKPDPSQNLAVQFGALYSITDWLAVGIGGSISGETKLYGATLRAYFGSR